MTNDSTGGVPNNIICDASGTASLCATVTAAALKTDGSGVTQPVSGTFWQATQPVSLASLPALSAGSALIGEVGDAQASTTSGQNGPLVQRAASTSAPSLTNGKTYPFSLNLNGGLRVDGASRNRLMEPSRPIRDGGRLGALAFHTLACGRGSQQH